LTPRSFVEQSFPSLRATCHSGRADATQACLTPTYASGHEVGPRPQQRRPLCSFPAAGAIFAPFPIVKLRLWQVADALRGSLDVLKLDCELLLRTHHLTVWARHLTRVTNELIQRSEERLARAQATMLAGVKNASGKRK